MQYRKLLKFGQLFLTTYYLEIVNIYPDLLRLTLRLSRYLRDVREASSKAF